MWLNKTSSDGTLLGRTSRRFLWCWLLLFSSLEGFTFSGYFSLQPTLHPGCSGSWTPPPALTSNMATFGCFAFPSLFCHIFTASATVLSRHLLPTGAFLTCTLFPHFCHVLWLKWGQEHPVQDPPLHLASQGCPFRLTHELKLLIL